MAKVSFINKDNLKIARENIGVKTSDMSKRFVKSGKDVVLSWESGDALPTWSQVSLLSKAYNVPELIFFSNKIIKKNKLIPDYRVKSGFDNVDNVKKLVNFVIRRQEWLEQRLKEEGKNKLLGIGSSLENPYDLAILIKEKLNIDLGVIKKIKGVNSRKNTLKYLIERAEDNGVFVGKTVSYHNIQVDEMRGLFISNDYCPFIILNRKDSLSAQIFSFIHELAHLFRKTESISNSLEFRKVDNVSSEEVFCNRVSVELLLPREDLCDDYYGKANILSLSEIYKLSPISIFYRLKDMGKIRSSESDYIEKALKSDSESFLIKKTHTKDKKGNYLNNMKDSNGRLFNLTVSKYYFENKIGYTEASSLLKFSVENV